MYGGSLVLYDTGDFVDDYAVDPVLRNDRGFCFGVELGPMGVETLRLAPTEVRDYAVHRASDAAARGPATGWNGAPGCSGRASSATAGRSCATSPSDVPL